MPVILLSPFSHHLRMPSFNVTLNIGCHGGDGNSNFRGNRSR
ncbi:hypothetical protein F01_420916 [Burkholderia cenocepacia]|nr:hypothetical protein F01_420916 [Burkholderia cenocepacia]